MRLPNGDHAVVDMAKLQDYCLSLTHPRGRHKARVFAAALGLSAVDAPLLEAALLQAAMNEEAQPTTADVHGQRYVINFGMRGPAGQAVVRSSWIIRSGEDTPRLVTCFVM